MASNSVSQEFYGELLPTLLTPRTYHFTLDVNIAYTVASLADTSMRMRFAQDDEVDNIMEETKELLDELEQFDVFLIANKVLIEEAIQSEYPELDIRVTLQPV